MSNSQQKTCANCKRIRLILNILILGGIVAVWGLYSMGEKPLPPAAETAGIQAANSIEIVDPYLRAAPPNAMASAAFGRLVNNSDQAHTLQAVHSSLADIVELHEHLHADGMMQMQQVESLAIPANSEVALQPGGYHIMLMRLSHSPAVGETADITLLFSDGSEKTVSFPVRKVSAPMSH